MNRKKLGLLLGAMAIAVCNALIAHSLLSGNAAPSAQALEQAQHGPRVLVARRDLPVGTIITPEAVRFVDWPKELMRLQDPTNQGRTNNAYFLDSTTSPAKLAGTVVRTTIPEGQPITRGALVAPGERGFLAAALGPGLRAITIPVTERSGVGGFVFPGDRVDLMLTQTVRPGGIGAGGIGGGEAGSGEQSLAVTETILRDLRVLATNQSMGGDAPGSRMEARATHTVTLEVSPRNAEKIEVAQSVGALSLALRALTEAPANPPTALAADPDRAIASGAVSIPANASRQDEERLIAQAAARADEDASGYVTGGDVSRFLRRGLPQLGAAPAPSGYARAGSTALVGAATPRASAPIAPSYRGGAVVMVSRGKEITPVSVGEQ